MTALLPRSVAVLALTMTVLSCGSDGDADPDAAGEQTRAVTQLVDFGLPEEQARCVVDELGADVVVAARDMDVLADGQVYQDAVASCPP